MDIHIRSTSFRDRQFHSPFQIDVIILSPVHAALLAHHQGIALHLPGRLHPLRIIFKFDHKLAAFDHLKRTDIHIQIQTRIPGKGVRSAHDALAHSGRLKPESPEQGSRQMGQ